MVKSCAPNKQSKTSCSTKPTSSRSTIKNITPSIATSNYNGIFNDHKSYNESIKLMIKILPTHPLFGTFDSFTEAVPQAILFKCVFYEFRPLNKLQEIHL